MEQDIKQENRGNSGANLKRLGESSQNEESPKKKKLELSNLIVYANDEHRSLTIQKTKDLNPEFEMDFFETTSTKIKNKYGNFEKLFEFKVDGVVIGTGRGFGKKAAKQECIQDAERNLRKIGKVVPFNTKPSVHNKKSAFARRKMAIPLPLSSVVEVKEEDVKKGNSESEAFIGLDLEDLAGLEFSHIQDAPISTSLSNFAQQNGLEFRTEVYEVKKEGSKMPDWGARVLLNGTEISAAVSSGKKAAKSACWTSAFSVLRQRCDYVERKGKRDGYEIVSKEFKSQAEPEVPIDEAGEPEVKDTSLEYQILDALEASPEKPKPQKPELKLEDKVIFYSAGLLDKNSERQTLPNEIRRPEYLQFTNAKTEAAPENNFVPLREHKDAIMRIKRRLKDFKAGSPYCVDQAARRAGIDIAKDMYTCGGNILAIREYLNSTRPRLYQATEDLFITKKSQYCVLSIRGVECAYGFGKFAKRVAFDNLEYFLRENSENRIHVVSALRHNGVRTEPQLTLALTPGDRQVGYILPANDAGRIVTPDQARFADLQAQQSKLKEKHEEVKPEIKLEDITLFMLEGMDCPLTIISRTANLNKFSMKWTEDETKNEKQGGGTWRATLAFNTTKIAEGEGNSKKEAKADAACNALKEMLQRCRVLEERKKEYAHENALGIEEVQNGMIDKAQPHLVRMAKAREKQANKNNKGLMLMRLMGWSGGGLGAAEDGIEQPIDHNAARYGRETTGLGVDEDGRCQVTVEQADVLISRYATSQITEDLSFSKGLRKEERKAIHMAVSRYGLRSRSYGKGADRYMVVSRTAQQKLMMLQQGCTLSQASLKQ